MKIYNNTTSTITLGNVTFVPGVNSNITTNMLNSDAYSYLYRGLFKIMDVDDNPLTLDQDLSSVNLTGYIQSLTDNNVKSNKPMANTTTYAISGVGSAFHINMIKYGSSTTGWFGFDVTEPSNVIPFIFPCDAIMTNITFSSQNVSTGKIILQKIPFSDTTKQLKVFSWDLRQVRIASSNSGQVAFKQGDRLAVQLDSSGNVGLLSTSFPVANVPINPWILITCTPTAVGTDFVDSFSGSFL